MVCIKLIFLPFIDPNPSDESTIFTTLNFVINDALKSVQKPIVMFDQPLWYKAMMIKKIKKSCHNYFAIVHVVQHFSLAFAEHSA